MHDPSSSRGGGVVSRLMTLVVLVLTLALVAPTGLASAAASGGHRPATAERATRHVFHPPVRLRPAQVLSVGRTVRRHRVVVLAPGAHRIKRGDVVLAGFGRHTPHGLLARATRVSRGPRGRVVLSTVPAGLQDALRPGAYRTTRPFGRAKAAPGVQARGRAGDPGIGTPAIGSPLSFLPRCSNPTVRNATLDGAVNLTGHVTSDLRVDWTGLHSATFRVSLDEDAWVKLALDAAASCSGGAPILTVPLNLMVAGVPVSVTLTLNLDTALAADGSIKVGAHQHSHVDIGFTYDGRVARSLSTEPTNTFTFDRPELRGKASAEVGVTASLAVGVLDLVAGRVSTRGAIGATADSTATPRWEVYATARAWADVVVWVPVVHIVLYKSGELTLLPVHRWSIARAVHLAAPSQLPAAVVGQPYAYQLQAVDGVGASRFGLTSGSLPPGLTLSASGLVSGTPAATGAPTATFTPGVSASDDVDSDSRALTLTVTALEPPTITTPRSISAGELGDPFSTQLGATSPNGGPLTWSGPDAASNHGYSISPDGVLSTSAAPLRAVVTVTVTDGRGMATTQQLTVTSRRLRPEPPDPPDLCDIKPWNCPQP